MKGDSKNAVLNDDDAPAIKFGGKKKAKAKKSRYNCGFVVSAFGLLGEDDDVESKEKDDEDEELGLPQISKPLQDSVLAPLPEENQPAQQEEAEEEGHVETATSKKKDKDKDKEKKASAAEEKPEDANSKVTGKKVPKHVREMQERLAKLKEAEETKKRQEEEKLRKQEEERLKQEELDRFAEEKNRLKKQREKEKLLKKKQQGKLFTAKQKEEARRLEAMRKQILANAKLDPPSGEPARRPLYHKKKSKPQHQSNGETTDANEIQEDVLSELASVEAENVEVTDVVDDNGVDDDDDDEEWDAKSWDEGDLTLPEKSVFADEEVDSESEPLPKKYMPIGLDEKVMPPKLENVDVQNKSVAEEKKIEVVDDEPVRNGQNLLSPICCIMSCRCWKDEVA